MGRNLSWGSGELSVMYQVYQVVPPVCQMDRSYLHFTAEKAEAQEINPLVHSRTTLIKSLSPCLGLVPTRSYRGLSSSDRV